MAFNVVYADKDKIKSSIEQGIIPIESLILTNGDNQSEAFYYDDNGKLKQVTKKSSFNSITEALSWINKNDYSGESISILQNDIIASHDLEMRFAACPSKDLCGNDKPSGWNSSSSH